MKMATKKATKKKSTRKPAAKIVKSVGIWDGIIGQYVIVRSRDQGVVAGYLEAAEGRLARVREPRQLYRWASTFVLIELASYGPRSETEQRYSRPGLEPLIMTETCGILPCHPDAAEKIRAIKGEAHSR
jgi:hypothetical protein